MLAYAGGAASTFTHSGTVDAQVGTTALNGAAVLGGPVWRRRPQA